MNKQERCTSVYSYYEEKPSITCQRVKGHDELHRWENKELYKSKRGSYAEGNFYEWNWS